MIGADVLPAMTVLQARALELEARIRTESAAGFAAARSARMSADGATVTISRDAWDAYRKATIAAGWAVGIPHPACPAALQPVAQGPRRES